VLDQLIGGSGPDGVTYPLATALLGYTPGSLLDETVDALAADDGGTLFGVIEKIIETGQDPRRFAEDLLHRLRDLVVVSAVPDAAARGIIEVPDDQAERFAGQAARFGRAELTRAADIVSQGLTDMRGATAPRLLLEIMCARILLPGLDHTAEGFGARIDRVERRLSVVGEPGTATSRPPAAATGAASASASAAPERVASQPAAEPSSVSSPAGPSVEESVPRPADAPAASSTRPVREPDAPANTHAAAAPAREAASGLTLVDARRLWPGVLERVKSMRRFSWLLLSQNAQVKDLHDGIITIGFASAGAAKNFRSSGADEILHQALIDELGVDWRVEGIIDGPGETGGGRESQPQPRTAPEPERTAPTPEQAAFAVPAAEPKTSVSAEPAGNPTPTAAPMSTAQATSQAEASASREEATPAEEPPGASTSARTPPGVGAAKSAIRPTRIRPAAKKGRSDEGVEVSDDDDVVDDSTLSSHELLARELGAQVIEDIRDDVS
jgi:DNA polymerase-3 subunit gamma/tau